MSWGGHVADMIARIKYNESLKESYRTRHNKIKDAYSSEFAKRNIHYLDTREIPQEELVEIRAAIRKKLTRERKIALVKTIAVFIIVFSGVMALIFKFIVPGIADFLGIVY